MYRVHLPGAVAVGGSRRQTISAEMLTGRPAFFGEDGRIYLLYAVAASGGSGSPRYTSNRSPVQ